jgi:hypothetical protein
MGVMRTRYNLPTTVAVSVAFALALSPGESAAKARGQAADPSLAWRALPKAPIAGRLGESAVWTGREMIVWGGVTRSGLGQRELRADSDGAAYDPATRRWRRIARSPSGVLGGGGTGSAWTGREMVVWAGNSPEGPAGGAVYNPRTNTWRRLAKGPLGVREGYASVWTGSELLIFGGHTGGVAAPTAAALNPRTGSWRRLPALNAVKGLTVANGAVWDGREAFVSARGLLIAFNPKTDRVRRISIAKAHIALQERSQLDPIGWTGADVIFSTGAGTSSQSITVVRYNPTTGRWQNAGVAPCKGSTQVAWIGDRLVAACGTNGLEIYTPRTDTWRTIKSGPSLLGSHGDSAIVWTGTTLIVWSGIVNKPGNPTPADGASITLKG